MPQAKHRITISVDGNCQEVMSILESKSGDLIINMKKPCARDYGAKIEAVIEDRFSVHPSKRSVGCTVNRHLRLADGTYVNGYTHAIPNRDDFVWPAGVWVSQSLALERYVCMPSGFDKVESLGSYLPDRQTLVYFWIVANKRCNAPYKAPDPIETLSLRFGEFIIWFSWSFVNMPSTPIGSEGIFSGKVTQNGINLVGGDARWVPCPTAEDLSLLISEGIRLTLDRHEGRLRDKMDFNPTDPIDNEIFRMLLRMMTKDPVA